MASCVAILRATTSAHQGTVIETIGDEVMCTFAFATSALQAACAMQIAVKNARFYGGNSMHISIGFHYGSVICDANDVFGGEAFACVLPNFDQTRFAGFGQI